LADDRPHSDFERIPGPGDTKARPRSQQWTDDRILGELTGGLVQVNVQACDPPGTLDDMDQLLPVRQVSTEQEMIVAAPR
jgi:hypothetical protein